MYSEAKILQQVNTQLVKIKKGSAYLKVNPFFF